jgi:hypothetical protein
MSTDLHHKKISQKKFQRTNVKPRSRNWQLTPLPGDRVCHKHRNLNKLKIYFRLVLKLFLSSRFSWILDLFVAFAKKSFICTSENHPCSVWFHNQDFYVWSANRYVADHLRKECAMLVADKQHFPSRSWAIWRPWPGAYVCTYMMSEFSAFSIFGEKFGHYVLKQNAMIIFGINIAIVLSQKGLFSLQCLGENISKLIALVPDSWNKTLGAILWLRFLRSFSQKSVLQGSYSVVCFFKSSLFIRVTRWVLEKIAQNVVNTFLSKLIHYLRCGKK